MSSLSSPIHNLINGLDKILSSLSSIVFETSKMKQYMTQMRKALQLCLSNLKSVHLEGGSILDAKGTLKRMTQESNWKTGVIGATEEILSALPYIEHSVSELSKSAQATQSYATVCEKIAYPLRTSVIEAEVNEHWNKIDPIQLNAFNTSMAKLMRLMVSVNHNAKELFEDMKNLFDITTGMQKFLSTVQKPQNSEQVSKIKRFLETFHTSTIGLIETTKTISDTIDRTSAPDLLHTQILKGTALNNESTSALYKLQELIKKRKIYKSSPGRLS